MPEYPSPNAPRRRVGVYGRLRGPAGSSPARMIGIAVGLLILLIVIILILTRYR
jgi:tetrahydromethanopterin S-methyltransferase subunit F